MYINNYLCREDNVFDDVHFVCVCLTQQNILKSCGQILMKFSVKVDNGNGNR